MLKMLHLFALMEGKKGEEENPKRRIRASLLNMFAIRLYYFIILSLIVVKIFLKKKTQSLIS